MPDENKSDRGSRSDDKESRQSAGRQGGSDSSTDRERDEQGRFESERGGSSSEGGSSKKK
jgi:general stress protein YciG